VRRMHEMLEGQVAILSSAAIDADRCAHLVDAMFKSSLYRADQHSFMLYPLRTLAGFLEKNQIPAASVQTNPLIAVLLAAHNTAIVLKDAGGTLRFNREFHNRRDLEHALRVLSTDPAWKDLIARHGADLADLYEKIFAHDSFTGRSCAMYAYEGIGCVYWHMVSKLLLAVQECFWSAVDAAAPARDIETLADYYYDLRSSLGLSQTAAEYGAFPTDPYSHTPIGRGAAQPGMTGRVKEEILTRLGEWGLRITSGQISFDPRLLRASELLTEPAVFQYFALDNSRQSIDLLPGTAAFTFARIPIIYSAGPADRQSISLTPTQGAPRVIAGSSLSREDSAQIFSRTAKIARVQFDFPAKLLRRDE